MNKLPGKFYRLFHCSSSYSLMPRMLLQAGKLLGVHHVCRFQSTQVEWEHALSEAEKLVGCPGSFMPFRSLLSDEMSNMVTHLRKLMTTNHPLMETAKRMVTEGPQSLQTRGLLVLLVSRAAGRVEEEAQLLEAESTPGIMQSQRRLAEITEMIYTAQLIHRGVVNLNYTPEQMINGSDESEAAGGAGADGDNGVDSDYELGNKIAILCGDYLLANACKALAALQNSQVVELVSSAISDYTEAEFLGSRDELGREVPDPVFDLQCWEEKTFLSVGSLIAKSSRSALLLAGHHDPAYLDLAYTFGRQLALAWQAWQELQPFLHLSNAADMSSSGSAMPSGGVGGALCELSPTVSSATMGLKSSDALEGITRNMKGVLNMTSSNMSTSASAAPVVSANVDLTSLPVVLHLQHLLRKSGGADGFIAGVTEAMTNGNSVDQMVMDALCRDGAGVAGATKVVRKHCQHAMRLLKVFPDSEARTALQNIILALEGTDT